jgi:glucose-6-phosphate isomerase
MAAATTRSVQLDYSGVLSDAIGKVGLSRGEIASAAKKADRARAALRKAIDKGTYGFDAALDDRQALAASVAEGKRLAHDADTLIVIGIGGSALGAMALETALSDRKRRLVVLDNVDPESVYRKLSGVDPARAAVNVITKSGETAETMANMLVVLDWMEAKLGREHVKRWTATTDPAKGDLLKLAQRLGMPTLPLASNIGGRFSVLTPVGFVPAAFIGIDLEGVLAGARAMREHCWSAKPEQNLGIVGAVILQLLAVKKKRPIQVLMTYAEALAHMTDWYCQLWAESLGKAFHRPGKPGGKARRAETGQTPVKAIGATDQHSQMQLYMEGPHDKVVTFFEVERFRHDVIIPRLHTDVDSVGYLGGMLLGDLLNKEKRGAELALTGARRPNFTYRLPEVSPRTIGELMYLFEFQTALSGELYDVNAFDQPGVLAGKVNTYALMGRQGYEKEAAALAKTLPKKPAVL